MAYQLFDSNQSVVDVSLDPNHSQNKLAEAPMSDVIVPHVVDETWNGGEHCFEGSHDTFCFMCGASENIVGCQTCSRCYHTQCMFPPLEPSQLPDVWFCPVCVGRNWHRPRLGTQEPSVTLLGTAVLSTAIQPANSDSTKQQNNSCVTDPADPQNGNRGSPPDFSEISENQKQRWKDAQQWKENAWYAPRGYVLDPSSAERFIPLSGDGPSIPFTTVIRDRFENSEKTHMVDESARVVQSHPVTTSSTLSTSKGKSRHTGRVARDKSPPRKRSKYSDLPGEVEKALDLIKSHLQSTSKYRRSQDDMESKAEILEQNMRIKEGEILICRQELRALKEKFSTEFSKSESIRAENVQLRNEVQELRSLVQTKELQMKNWQNMLKTMMGVDGSSSTS